MGPDTFKQYLDLLSSSPSRKRGKRTVSGSVTTRRGCRTGRAVIPMNIGKHVCREKVAIILGDAPFLISKPFLQRMGAVLDLVKGQVTFKKLGGLDEPGRVINSSLRH